MARSLLDRLIKYKITTERYQQEFKAFTDLNYTEEQANKIIVRKYS